MNQIPGRIATTMKPDHLLFEKRHNPLAKILRRFTYLLTALAAAMLSSAAGSAQAALLIEQPYGFFGVVNPTGHSAIYFERICAETPLKLRRCQPGELGAVVSRYQGISGYDWVAIPLVPYLYSVENVASVQPRVLPLTVEHLRGRYHEAHLLGLGKNLRAGSLIKGGWTQLVGAAYERRIYVFRFQTAEEQDDALIARLNAAPNHSHFDLIVNNCADFARKQLNFYFPGTFKRGIFPDAGVSTPKQIAHKLARRAQKHPEMQLTVFEIPQIPGNRRPSRSNKDVDESLSTTLYAIPIAIVSPYLSGGLLVDYLFRGRYRILPKHPLVLAPDDLTAWARPPSTSHPQPAPLLSAENDAKSDTPLPALHGLSEPPSIFIAAPDSKEENSGVAFDKRLP
jgi:hypothetical protein